MAENAESPKRFFKQVLSRGPYYEMYRFLEANPNASVYGRVYSNSRYAHDRSTGVEINLEGWLGVDEEKPVTDDEAAGKLADALQQALSDKVVSWNQQLTKELYSELEYQQKDEVLAEWMENNEIRFTEDGEQVSMVNYMPVTNLKPEVRDKVLRDYADLFDRAPEEVLAALVKRDTRFDKHGNRVDTSQFKAVTELDRKLQARIFDRFRNILVEDEFWSEFIQDEWKEKLGALGFGRIQIRYSLGYSQGDGASFTADTIDVKKLCSQMLKEKV